MEELTHNEDRDRYELTLGGMLVGICSYCDDGDVREFASTHVQDGYTGRGYAATMVRQALEDARAAGKRVRPTCSYVESYVERHPDYQDLLEQVA